jgi:hypothetical protein
MPDTIREQIIQSIMTAMGAYSFTTMTAPTMFRGQIYFDVTVDALPIISVLPQAEDAARENYYFSVCQMPVDILCLVSLGDNNPSELGEAVHGELIEAVMTTDNADADDIQYQGGGVTEYPDQLGQKVLSVAIRVVVEYRFDLGNPYQSTK